MKISTIIVTFNNKDTILQCIDSVLLQNKDSLSKIIVIDNCSSDNTVKIINQKTTQGNNIHLIQNGKNLGFAKAVNQGLDILAKESSDLVLLLNPDAFLEKNLFNKAIDEFKSNKKLGALNPVILYPDGKIWWIGNQLFSKKRLLTDFSTIKVAEHVFKGELYSKKHFSVIDNSHQNSLLTGCVMFINSLLIKNGLRLDHNYFMYAEDLDFSIKILELGYNLKTSPSIIAYHHAKNEVGDQLNLGNFGKKIKKIKIYFSSLARFIYKQYGIFYLLAWLIKTQLYLLLKTLKLLLHYFKEKA